MPEQLKLPLVRKDQSTTDGLEDLFKPNTNTSLIGPVEPPNYLRNDFNLCRLPLFIASDKRADRFRNIYLEFDKVQVSDENGAQIKATWEVQHSNRLGLPGGFDRDVWTIGILGIIDELTEHGRYQCPKRIQLGPAKAFLRRIGRKTTGGADIKALQESIERLAITTCTSKGAFNCPTYGGYLIGKSFKLLDGWGFIGQPDGNGGIHETNFIELSDFVRANLAPEGYITLVDATYLRSLRGEITKQLYQLLSYLFWKAAQKGQITYPMHWSHVANYLGVTGWTGLKKAKDRLKGAILELKTKGYLDESSDWEGDRFIFKPGPVYIEEHVKRVQAKAQYQAWVTGKALPSQPKSKARPGVKTNNQIGPDDHRRNILHIQACRRLFGQPVSFDKLTEHGWTEADLQATVSTMRRTTAD